MVDEVSIELAKVQVYDEVNIQSNAPESIRVAAGTPVLLRLVYQTDDQPKTQEKWTFKLSNDVDGAHPSHVDKEIVDSKAAPDDAISFLGDERVFTEPGTYTLNFAVHGAVARKPWDSTEEFTPIDAKDHAGSIQVIVE